MSDLFNLSSILNEVTETLVQTDNVSTILPMCIKQLKNIDKSIFESTSNLHVSILEADSKKKENEKFADFFKEYKNTIQEYIMQARTLASTFTINMETFADANKDLECSIDNLSDNITFNGIEFTNLSEDNSPNIQPYCAFKKEFAFIGKLMQDLGPMASENQKTQIIATVCNNLSKEIQNGWLNNCAKKISGNENVDKCGFARSMYNYFVKGSNVCLNVDIGLLKQCQLDIANYTRFTNSIDKSVNDFCLGLEKVRDEVGSLFFRNKDHKLPIKTDVDGIEDKVYRLNDYSFNQMNIFISTKISQINELCNLYMIALSIKMDCIYKYLKQCRDIINMVNDTPCGDYCGFSDDDLGDDIDFGDFDDDSKDVVQDDSIDIETECYLFEASIYEQTRAIESLMYKKEMYESLLEDSVSGTTNRNTDNTASNNNDKGFFRKALDKIKAVIDAIIRRIKVLIEKFKSFFTKNYSKRIAYIRTGIQNINKVQIPSDWTIQKMNVSKLLTLNVPQLVETDFDLLQDQEKYIESKYPGIIDKPTEQNQSIKDRMMAICMPSQKEVPYTNTDRQEGIRFVTQEYEDKALKSIDDNNKVIEQSRNKIDTLLTVKETAIDDYYGMMGISEDKVDIVGTNGQTLKSVEQKPVNNITGKPENNIDQKVNAERNKADKAEQQANAEEEKEKNRQKQEEENRRQTAINNYFSINSEIITASMNIYVTMINKHIKFLEKLNNMSR